MNAGRTRVLVIDDDADLRMVLCAALEDEGFEVRSASDGARGLDSQRKDPAHIVVTDIFMPEKEGMETLMTFLKEFPGTKVIVMSGGGTKKGVDYLKVAVELGASKSFSKPFDPQKLAAAVRELARAR
jgi:DNA-binding NtrC family response regulator